MLFDETRIHIVSCNKSHAFVLVRLAGAEQHSNVPVGVLLPQGLQPAAVAARHAMVVAFCQLLKFHA